MAIMEEQLKSLTELVKELTNPIKSQVLLGSYNKSLNQQLNEVKTKTNSLRNDLFSIRQMHQSFQDNFKIELEQANKKIRVNY